MKSSTWYNGDGWLTATSILPVLPLTRQDGVFQGKTLNNLKSFIERRLSGDPLEPICVFVPGGMLVGFVGSSAALLRWATLHGESDGDFRQAYGISNAASSTGDTFMMVDVACLPSGTWLPVVKVSYPHVSAWSLAYHMVDAIVIARVKKSIESL